MFNVRDVLSSYGIQIEVVSSVSNDIADIFWVTSSAKLSQIKALEDDLAYKLGYSLVRVYPDPIKRAIVIEAHRLQDEKIKRDEKKLSKLTNYKVALGVSPFEVITHDFTTDPHLLIAGTTGSGKSTALHNIVTHLLKYNRNTFIIPIDFKGTELDIYERFIPSTFKVVSNTFTDYYDHATYLLAEAVRLMNVRYEILQDHGYKDLVEYNNTESDKLTRVFVVIDELADLMLGAKKKAEEVEKNIVLLAQKARAAGVHLIISTQRPTVDVLTGHIKANISTRVALRTSTALESRIIIDENGAESLKVGDMIYLNNKGLTTGKSFFFTKSQAKKDVSSIKVMEDTSFSFYQQNKEYNIYERMAELDYGDGPVGLIIKETLDLMGGKANAWELMLKAFEGRNPYMLIAHTAFVLNYLELRGEIKITRDIGKTTKYFTRSDMEGMIIERVTEEEPDEDEFESEDERDEEVTEEQLDRLNLSTKVAIMVQAIQNIQDNKTSKN